MVAGLARRLGGARFLRPDVFTSLQNRFRVLKRLRFFLLKAFHVNSSFPSSLQGYILEFEYFLEIKFILEVVLEFEYFLETKFALEFSVILELNFEIS